MLNTAQPQNNNAVAHRVAQYREEALALRAIAATHEDPEAQQRLLKMADSRDHSAARLLAGQPTEAILELPHTASKAEVQDARRLQSVRHGDDVYLPACAPTATPFPNVFARSAVFSAGAEEHPLVEAEIPVAGGDRRILFTGLRLNDFDVRVYCGCLKAYRTRPLDKTAEADNVSGSFAVQTTFFKFITGVLGMAYTPETHFAVRGSLYRLFQANLTLIQRHEVSTCPNLIKGRFTDGLAQYDLTTLPSLTKTPGATAEQTKQQRAARQTILGQSLSGSDEIAFSLYANIAELFGPTDWTALSDTVTKYRGLSAWLFAFYSTHSVPFDYKMSRLLELSRAHDLAEQPDKPRTLSQKKKELRDFRCAIKDNLTALSKSKAGEPAFVDRFEVDELNDTIRVHLTQWRVKKAA